MFSALQAGAGGDEFQPVVLLLRRWPAFVRSCLLLFVLILLAGPTAHGASSGGAGRRHFLHELPRTVDAAHPAIAPVAAAVRAVSSDPIEQLSLVESVTRLLVEYDSDQRVYGENEYQATLDQMLERAHGREWEYLRDDCDGRAVFAAHLLAALDIPWRLEASWWKRHAWVSARVAGVRYDLLDLAPHDPELQGRAYRWLGRHLVRPSRRPPEVSLYAAWLLRTEADERVGRRLGLLSTGPNGWRRRYPVNHAMAPRDWIAAPGRREGEGRYSTLVDAGGD